MPVEVKSRPPHSFTHSTASTAFRTQGLRPQGLRGCLESTTADFSQEFILSQPLYDGTAQSGHDARAAS
jgi:hypothetical protein